MKVFQGKVERERVSDTGDPTFDFDYSIGYDYFSDVVNEMERHEGKNIRVTVEVLPEEEEEKEEDE